MHATAPRIIHVHEAEVAGDVESVLDYGWAIVLLTMLAVLLATAWIVATPRAGAFLAQPAAGAGTAADQVLIADDGTAYQPQVGGAQQVTVPVTVTALVGPPAPATLR